MAVIYDEDFYADRRSGSMASAERVIPYILDIIQPESVLDIGCGIGDWLSVFKNKFNTKEILGVDGSYVTSNMLKISKNEFIAHDLEKIFVSSKKFDLAMSLEVGEHLPDACADNLVQSLTQASDVIIFSAALPGQTGTHHINEQPPEYWAKKFIGSGYLCIDCIRKAIWNMSDIDVWYRQNILLYIKAEVYENKYKQKLDVYREQTDIDFLIRVHPELLLYFKNKFYQTRRLEGFIRYHLKPLKNWLTGKKYYRPV